MESFKVKITEDTPGIVFDPSQEIFEISGRSLPEDVNSFYNPVLSWLEDYFKSPNTKTRFSFKLSYFNTASSKMILDILMRLETFHKTNNSVLIEWNYPEDDEDMREAGNEYSELVELPFEKISYKE